MHEKLLKWELSTTKKQTNKQKTQHIHIIVLKKNIDYC